MSRRAVVAAALLAAVAMSRSAAADVTHTCVEAANAGQSLRDAGKLSGAREAFVQCSVASCPALVRESCERWAAEIEPRVPTIVLGARDETGNDLTNVRISLDGKPLSVTIDGRSMPVDPGPHELLFEADGHTPVRQFLVAREGEHTRGVVAILPAIRAPRATADVPGPPASSPRNLTPLFIAGGVGVVGILGFTTFGLWGRSERDRLADTCAPSRTCPASDVRAVQTKYVVADVSLVVGVVGLGVLATYLLAPLFEHEAPSKANRLSVDAGPVRGGALGAVRFDY